MIRVSVVLSIHNRSKLFQRALPSYVRQRMPRTDFELVIVDDCSTENIKEAWLPFSKELQITYVRFDHKRHPLWKKRNPEWQPGQRENWYHTPSLTTNAGVSLAEGEVIGLCHPEIIHGPDNCFRAAALISEIPAFWFGRTYLGTPETNQWLDRNRWTVHNWPSLLRAIQAQKLQQFRENELYWYTSFLPKRAVEQIGGVDFVYLGGVAAEDDDFRDRIVRAGFPARYDAGIEGIHQDHSHETEFHRLRNTPEWARGLEHNRRIYFERKHHKWYPERANTNEDWTAAECIVDVEKVRL